MAHDTRRTLSVAFGAYGPVHPLIAKILEAPAVVGFGCCCAIKQHGFAAKSWENKGGNCQQDSFEAIYRGVGLLKLSLAAFLRLLFGVSCIIGEVPAVS